MKKEGSLKSILAILVIILLCLVSFGGIYAKDKNIMKNILPEYVLGMDLDTNTVIKLDVVKDEDDSSENIEESDETEEDVEATVDDTEDVVEDVADTETEVETAEEEEADDTGIKQFAEYPKITAVTVDTHGIDYGMPEVEEMFDYTEYVNNYMSQYYGS